MDQICDRHFRLMIADDDHGGAAHCACTLAAEWRTLSDEYWRIRRLPKQSEFERGYAAGLERAAQVSDSLASQYTLMAPQDVAQAIRAEAKKDII